MAHETRGESRPDLHRLSRMRDPDGQKTYLTVTLDLTQDDWMQTLKDLVESVRLGLSADDATASNFHRAFDQAFVAVERIANQGAKGAAVFVSPMHSVDEAYALDAPPEDHVVLGDSPDLTRLE